MLNAIAGGLIVVLIALLYLIQRLRALHMLLVAPLPQAITTRGVVPLDPKNRAEYFNARSKDYPKNSPRRKLYEEAAKRMAS